MSVFPTKSEIHAGLCEIRAGAEAPAAGIFVQPNLALLNIQSMKTTLIALFILLLTGGICQTALTQVLYEALDLSTEDPISFYPDERLVLGPEGSIEIAFYVDKDDIRKRMSKRKRCMLMKRDTFGEKCMVAIADQNDTRVVIMLNNSLTRIGFFNGKDFASVEYNFRTRRIFHVIFSTKDQQTQVFINGKLEATLSIGYNENYEPLPLRIGTADGSSHPFTGRIWTLRVWNKALSALDVQN